METLVRTLSPVMIPVSANFADEKSASRLTSPVSAPRDLFSYVLNATVGTTRVLTLSLMAAVILAIPALSGALAYHVASQNAALTVISTQHVPSSESGQFIVVASDSEKSLVRG